MSNEEQALFQAIAGFGITLITFMAMFYWFVGGNCGN